MIILLYLLIQVQKHDHFTPGNGKQELYPGAGVYISCVELHHIHDRAGYNPADIITSMMAFFYSEEEMATSVPFRENGSKMKGKVLQQQILHAILGKIFYWNMSCLSNQVFSLSGSTQHAVRIDFS